MRTAADAAAASVRVRERRMSGKDASSRSAFLCHASRNSYTVLPPAAPPAGSVPTRRSILRRALALAAVVLGAMTPAATAATTLNVIPHGQWEPGVSWGSAPGLLPADTQARMYDRLTPLFRDVTDAQLVPSADGSGYFKSAALLDENDPSFVVAETVGGTAPGVGTVSARIKRDAYGVPHIYSDTDAGAIFGAGYVVAQDRNLLLDQA